VRRYIQLLSALSAKHGVPVVFVVPEFNLCDWRSSASERITPFLPNGQTEVWLDKLALATEYLDEGRYSEAGALALQMIELEKTHPLGYELFADCKRKSNSPAEAKEYLELARDTAYYGRAVGQPRMYSVIYNTLLETAEPHHIRLVNLKEIIHEYLDGDIPDRRLFLDYCHLTVEGIQLAMAHTAKAVLECMGYGSVPLNNLWALAQRTTPSAEIQACAHLCAGIHNAHWGQSQEKVAYHCKKAMEIAPGVAGKLIAHYTALINRRVSSELCKSYEELLNSNIALQYEGGTGLLHPPGGKILDLVLSDSMIDALGSPAIRAKVEELRIKEHAVAFKKLNLLEHFYCQSSYDCFLGKLTPYFQAKDIVSIFHFVLKEPEPLQLALTYRTVLVDTLAAGIRISVNDGDIATLASSKRWVTADVEVQRGMLKRGVNRIKIHWATNLQPAAQTTRFPAIDYLLNRIYPSWGEIHSFTLVNR
jgi:hypothetical protein